MVEITNTSTKLTTHLICEILTYLDIGELFKQGAIQLNKKIYEQQFLTRQVTISHLGVLEDYALEKLYIERVLNKKLKDLFC